MKESGMSNVAISEELGIPESTIRNLLKRVKETKLAIINRIANVLRNAVSKYGFIDIGEGVEQYLGVSNTKLRNAVALLENEGYTTHYLREQQLGTGKRTSIKVLAAPGVTFKEVYNNRANIAIPNHASDDGGHSFTESMDISNISSNRISVVKDPERDGLIELRSGVPELNMGAARYAQVRIGVDGTHYIKGMAVINNNNLPPGKDIVFYTSKDVGSNPTDTLKEQKVGDVNPFGTTIKPQRVYTDKDGNSLPSALNIVYEEGDWNTWSRTLSSQFLSKQPSSLARQQLDVVLQNRKSELDEILSLTNPAVKAHLLMQFADGVDAESVHLKAAALPRQTTSVLLPSPSIKPTEIYAPNYPNGQEVVLVRHPHGGVFEIPRLVVNNKNPNMRSVIGSAKDAVGIHPDVAKRLSGADFDGDSVLVIPSNKKIRTAPALEGLKDFDPITSYPPIAGMKPMTPSGKQMQMGIVSNLITDMTIKGASQSEIARAVRHSMVVIDAEKHQLNYRQSYLDNGIAALKTKYQEGGASTIISKSNAGIRVPHRKENYAIDPVSGEKVWTYTGKTYIDSKGNEVSSTVKSRRGYENDPYDLSSGTHIEKTYAEYATNMRNLANQARLEYTKTSPRPYNPQSRITYKNEVTSLNAKLKLAQRNQPLERKAQLVAGEIYRRKLKNNPTMSNADKQTARGRALVLARLRVGAKKTLIDITPREWEAIQMGAISHTKLTHILRNSNMDHVKSLATPKRNQGLSAGKITRANQLLDMGYTNAEVAGALGVPVSTIINRNQDDN
jgi:DNA-binding Lrp family transcriptional regulator